MKKLITLLITFLMVTLVLAQPTPPSPVKLIVTVNDIKINYEDTKVTNLRTGEVLTASDVPGLYIRNGVGLFDLSKFKQGFAPYSSFPPYEGDTIEVIGCNVHPDCTTTFLIESLAPRTVSINIVDEEIPIIQCWDGSIVSDISLCPELEPEPEPEYVCWDDSIVSDPTDCPEQPEPEPEESVTKVSSNEDKSSAFIEAEYGQLIEVCLTHTKLSKLIDSVIEFDGEEIDVKEELCFTTIALTSIYDEDFGLEPYMLFEEEAITYKYFFEDEIDFAQIDEEEPLEITFLGEEIKIIKRSSNEIKVRSGEKESFEEGISKVISGKKVIVNTITQDVISVSVDGITETIKEGNNKKVNGLNILVDIILYKSYEDGSVELIIGTQTDKTIKDGDDFELFIEDDEEYKWIIQEYIGITNQEEYKSIDEDEEFTPFGIGEKLVLPNDYLEIEFREVSESDTVKLEFKVKDTNLYVKGDDESFFFGTDEYSKLYINSNGIYDEDDVLITDDKVRIGNSDVYLELGSVKIGLLTIKLDMSDILYDGISYLSKDKKYMDYFGIIFEDPEKAVEDKKGFKVTVPEETPEVTISINGEVEVSEPSGEPFVEPGTIEPTEPVEPTTEPTTIPTTTTVLPTEPKPTEPIVEPPIEPDSKMFEMILGLLGIILAALGIKWRAGFMGLARHHWKAGRKLQAIKMLLTATKRAKEDFYKNNKK